MEAKKRIEELDIVKGISIIFVCIWHFNEMTGVNIYGKVLGYALSRCGESVMFLFIFLSGYVFKSKGSIGIDIKNKVKQLILPYLKFSAFFSVTYLIRYVLIAKMDIRLFIRNTICNFFAFKFLDIPVLGSGTNVMKYAFTPYWYINEIFMAFILFIIINKLVEKRSVYIKMIAAAILLSATGLLMYLDIGSLLENTYASQVSFFTIPINITGFAGLLMIGTILHHYNIFDIEAYSKRFTTILFSVCLLFTVLQYSQYNNHYALMYGKWGQYGVLNVLTTTIAGFALTYSLIYISHFLKRNKLFKRSLSFLGANTLDILLLHFGIAELICMIFGFWYPIYDISVYPPEGFAWWHLIIVTVFTSVCIGIYFAIRQKMKTFTASGAPHKSC